MISNSEKRIEVGTKFQIIFYLFIISQWVPLCMCTEMYDIGVASLKLLYQWKSRFASGFLTCSSYIVY